MTIDPVPPIMVGMPYAKRLFALCESLGVSRTDLLGQAVANPQAWDPGQERLPLADLVAMFGAGQALTGRRDLGLEFARQARPETFGVLGYALMTCSTLAEAIGLLLRFREVLFDDGYSQAHLAREAGAAKMQWVVRSDRGPHAPPYSALLAESLLASWFVVARLMTGVDLTLREVRFLHGAPPQPQAFDAFFGCPVHFGAGENALIFDPELLVQPMVHADASLNLAMCSEARRAMQRARAAQGLAARVHQALLPLMPRCEATLEHVAASLGTTPRALQRELARESRSFHTLLQAARQELAVVYLRDGALSVLDVALLLGYAEQSSFTRAFGTWYGTTPIAWRREHGGAAPSAAPGGSRRPGGSPRR